ncbi:aldose epimerase family protein [Brevundimonas bacteroides]|uniref:aldose epimerase family protein n=1 Tax=Brevundimonas bacteroides TaxID=74311 RepID=UPI0004980853|nr:hypothetical protein [Brevundimonas bacteroides]
MSADIVTLENARLRLRVVPSNGGAVLDLVTHSGQVILEAPGGPHGPPQGLGCFPMTPFCGRLPGGLVEAGQGSTIVLDPNLAQGGVAHGVGWLRPWRVLSQTSSAVVLGFDHVASRAVWPWRFECRQLIRLRGNTAAITLRTRNLDETSMPCASGLHPYLAVSAGDALVLDATPLADPQPGEGVLAEGRCLRLGRDGHEVRLQSSAGPWMVYRPADRAAVCLEPHRGGFDQAPEIALEPGAEQMISVQIAVG